MKTIKTMLVIAALVFGLGAIAEATQIPLPYSTLPAGAPGTGGYITNLANGWTNSTISTNVTQSWNISTVTMNSVTNYITNSVVQYADVDVSRVTDFTLMSTIGVNAGADVGSITNRLLTFARVSDSGFIDNVNQLTLKSPAFGVTNWSTGTNIIQWVGTFNKVRLVQDQWCSTNGEVMTNVSLDVPYKPIVPTGSSNPSGH